MIDPNELKELSLNYERLKRHYDLNIKGYDEIALRDMAHAVRVWFDMKEIAKNFFDEANIKFQSYGLTKQFYNLIKREEYIIIGFSGEVSSWTYDALTEAEGLDYENFEISITVRMSKFNPAYLTDFKAIFNTIEHPNKYKIIKKGIENKKQTFEQWLNSECVRIKYSNKEKKLNAFNIPREIFVRRVANILGGSHPKGGDDYENKYNEPVKHLMSIKTLGLPLPYLITLKIAKEILDNFEVVNKTI